MVTTKAVIRAVSDRLATVSSRQKMRFWLIGMTLVVIGAATLGLVLMPGRQDPAARPGHYVDPPDGRSREGQTEQRTSATSTSQTSTPASIGVETTSPTSRPGTEDAEHRSTNVVVTTNTDFPVTVPSTMAYTEASTAGISEKRSDFSSTPTIFGTTSTTDSASASTQAEPQGTEAPATEVTEAPKMPDLTVLWQKFLEPPGLDESLGCEEPSVAFDENEPSMNTFSSSNSLWTFYKPGDFCILVQSDVAAMDPQIKQKAQDEAGQLQYNYSLIKDFHRQLPYNLSVPDDLAQHSILFKVLSYCDILPIVPFKQCRSMHDQYLVTLT